MRDRDGQSTRQKEIGSLAHVKLLTSCFQGKEHGHEAERSAQHAGCENPVA